MVPQSLLKHTVSICCYLMLFTPFISRAQQGFSFNHFTTDEGLASNDVRSLYQDQKGFIWLGTINGIQRFDGSKFISYSLKGKKGSDDLPVSNLEYIIPDNKGKLWLYFPEIREAGVFDPAKFTYQKIPIRPKQPLPGRINVRMWKDSKHNIYLNVQPAGILRYDSLSNSFVSTTEIAFPKGWNVGPSSFEDTIQQRTWFCTDSGFVLFDHKTGKTYTRHNNPQQIPLLNNWRIQEAVSHIFIDKQRRYWVFNWPVYGGGGQVLHCLDETGTRYLKDTAGLTVYTGKYGEYRNFYQTPRNNIWIFGLNTLFNYNNRLKKFFYYANSESETLLNIHYDQVNDVLEDSEGGTWVATNQGLFFAAPGEEGNGVANVFFTEKNESKDFTDVLQLKNGEYWITNWSKGVLVLDKNFKRKSYNIFKNYPADWVYARREGTKLTWCMHQEKATGDIWIGSNGGLVTRYNPQSDKTTFYNPPEFANATIRYITEDQAGNIWFSTQRGRVVKYSGGKFTVVKDFGSGIAIKIFFDKDNWLWVAVQGTGLFALNPSNGRLIQQYVDGKTDHNLFAVNASDIDQLNDSVIAFGASALNLVNKRTGKVRIISYENGLPSNSVQRLRIDNKGYLWIVTNNGLCRYNPFNDNITPYNKKDGVILAEKTVAADALGTDGSVIFAGGNALMFFHPEIFTTNQQPPDVTITDFKLYNEYLPIDSLISQPTVKLKYEQNSFSIYFSALSFLNRDKLAYYYKMEGIDDGWVRADREQMVNYSLLPPGHYTFNVYCENIDGVRSKNITTFSIYIRPPFWRTWFFIGLMATALAGLLYFIHRLRINKILAVENLRNRVARDLHDDMGSTLSTINILSTMAKSKLSTDNVRASEYIGKISDNSQRMMEAMDDIVWSIKPMNDSMQRITARMREIATSVLEAKDIDLDFRTDPSIDEVKMDMEARRDFFLLFKEAINNIAKYSRCNLARVFLTVHNKRLIMRVEDDGIGFNIQEADGNGLGNMQKRATNLKGRLNIQSKPGAGTQITLNIPIA